MNSSKKLFFIGWDYAAPVSAPVSVVLKHALMDSGFPWEPVAIVHDVVLTDAVDSIPLMSTEEFLERKDFDQIDVLLQVKDSVQRALWMRRIRDLGIRQVDQGELLRRYAAELLSRGESRQLGPVTLPQAFDDQACTALQEWNWKWIDPLSSRIFHAYLLFLQSGLITALGEVVNAESSEHPFFQAKDPHVEAFKGVSGSGLVWEIAGSRSAFIEHALVKNNIGDWQYGFSSLDDQLAAAEGHRLCQLFAGLGLTPELSVLKVVGLRIDQDAVAGARIPSAGTPSKYVRIDVEEPVPVLLWLDKTSENLLARVRIRRPTDLLHCLQQFPLEQLSLRCDRPGPDGLELVVCKYATSPR